jgi:hypothetical protein
MPIAFDSHVVFTPAALNLATTAWVAAVVTNGGSVSEVRKAIVDNLIVGLKTDGIFNKLDRLWIYAAENEPSALTDMIALSLATNISATAFSADDGYTGDGVADYIDTNFNLTSGTNFLQNNACAFAWQNTSGTGTGNIISSSDFFGTQLNTKFTDNTCYWGITDSGSGSLPAASGSTGLYTMVRTGSTAQRLDLNGSQIDSNSDASAAISSINLWSLHGFSNFDARQVSCLGIGGALNSTESTNLYNRIRTYMTAVGVP